MASKQSERIKLWGIVQGVGFRPYVAKSAALLGMKGQVLNIGGLVEITVTDTPERISSFLDYLIDNKPIPAEIVHIRREPVSYREFDSFTIVKSSEGNDDATMIPVDLAICPDCLNELKNSDDPRFQHPFISCMVCGPRYTIIDRVPYDRENTSMDEFPMCGFCESQYTDINNRRYHAQTISCHECGPQLLWKENAEQENNTHKTLYSDAEILDKASSILKGGGVIAFKSVGGYNLVADPLNERAVEILRSIKKRESKPFAIMFKSIEQIKEYCYADPVEEHLLNSSARPIILLEHRDLPYPDINRSRFIGSFLPSFAAQYMLLDRISPLIFTSANLSDMPMIKDEEEMFSLMRSKPEISGVIYNERQIRVRADDSVARVIDGQPQMIRRSKGYAPVPLYINTDLNSDMAAAEHKHPNDMMIFAAGSQLKNSFALTKGPFTYMSQFFGDMDTLENQKLYEDNVSRLEALFRIKPQIVACDMHPLYYTTGFAERYAEKNGLPIIRVQHHHAHVASVMAENDIKGSVIGVSFDGTGYGTDGCIWGGEFFICSGANVKRISHLKYIDMIGGDASVKDARRSAISYIHAFDNGYTDSGDPEQITVDISDIIEYGRNRLIEQHDSVLIIAALKKRINTVKSSSMGRLFDAVSALLGIKDYNDYEGQCAIMLEDAASFAQRCPGADAACDLALSFHDRITEMILAQCMKARKTYVTDKVALTGGTFQNKILMEATLKALRSHGFTPYYNISVSPNDGGIALGQAYVAMHSDI